MTSELTERPLKALVLAPRGRDASVACSLIEQTGVACVACPTLSAMVDTLDDDVAFLLITEEAIRSADLKPLSVWLANQPPWSDPPFLLVTDHGGGPERNPIASRWLETLGNVSFIERPFHPTTLLSVARAAVKGRRRQYETRRLLSHLRESDRRLRTALQAGRLAPWEFDFATSGLAVSDEGKSLLGRPGVQEVGLDDLMRGMAADDRSRVATALGRSVATGEDFAADLRFGRPDGRLLWLDVRARLVRDFRGVPRRFVGLASDITTRKSAEAALQGTNEQLEKHVEERTAQLRSAHDALVSQIAERERTEAQLRQMQKLESIGQLTGGVAHDFNNLLTAVIGNLELLRKRVPASAASDRLIDGAMQGAQRGAALTQRLLAFARHQALDARPVDLVELVRGMDDLLRRSIGPSVTMLQHLPTGLPAGPCRRQPGGTRAAQPGGQQPRCHAERGHGDAGARCRRDGRNARSRRRALRPAHGGRHGLGNGRRDASQGDRAFLFDQGCRQGHRAWPVDDPWAGAAAQRGVASVQHARAGDAGRTMAASRRESGGGGVRACRERHAGGQEGRDAALRDDDFLISLSTTSLLEDLGHTVITASSGPEALNVLRAGQPIDMMITDYAMPGMTGLQLAEEARALRPDLPILLATGYADLPTKSCFDLPRLNKPYQQMQLAEQIQGLLG